MDLLFSGSVGVFAGRLVVVVCVVICAWFGFVILICLFGGFGVSCVWCCLLWSLATVDLLFIWLLIVL